MSSAYADKSITEIIHDFIVVRGDLTEGYAREQLVEALEQHEQAAKAVAWDEGYEAHRNDYWDGSGGDSPYEKAGR